MPPHYPTTAEGHRWWLGRDLHYYQDFLPGVRLNPHLVTVRTDPETHLLLLVDLEWVVRDKRSPEILFDLAVSRCYDDPHAAYEGARKILLRWRNAYDDALGKLERVHQDRGDK